MTPPTDTSDRNPHGRRRERRRPGQTGPRPGSRPRLGWGVPALTAILLAATGALVAGPLTGGSADPPGTVSAAASASVLFADDFEDGDAAGWSKSGGSWSVVTDGSKALRQDKTASELARQFAGSTSWTDVTVAARVRPLGFGATGGLAGIAARASSNTTFLRLVLVSPGRAELQAVASGRVTTVGGRNLTVGTGRSYDLSLTVSGTTARAFADGQLVASGTVPAGSGRIALLTSYAAASFDDVAVSPPTGTPAATAPATSTASASPTVQPTTTAPTTTAPTATAPTTTAPTTTAPSASPTRTAAPTTAPPASSGPPPSWPRATGDVHVDSTISVSGTFDGGLKRYSGVSDGGQEEGQDPLFTVADGGTVQNVVIGSPAADGIHCKGTCTLRNVWWEDVGEDAATFKGTSASQTMTIDGGGARAASDKVFQHNGPGTMIIQNFQVENFGKLYRSCGNCSSQYRRAVIVRNVVITAPGKALVGINTNYGDTATLSGITIVGDSSRKISVCDRYTGNSSGSEPTKTGSGADGTYCRYTTSDITYR